MPELDTRTKIHIAVGVWTSFADTNVQLGEISKIIEVLSNNSYFGFDADEGTGEVQFWFNNFRAHFDQTEAEMTKLIQSYPNKADIKESLIDIAQRIVVSDQELSTQEEAALSKLKAWLD